MSKYHGRALVGVFLALEAMSMHCLLYFTLEINKPYFVSCFLSSRSILFLG